MTKIKCPDCGKEATYQFIPKPSQFEKTFSSINLELSCGHEYVMLSYKHLDGLQSLINRLDERVTALEG